MIRAGALLLLSAGLAPAPAWAQAAPASHAAPTARQAAGARLIAAMLPDAEMSRIFIAAFDAGVESALVDDEQKSLYAAHPGMRDHVWQPIRAQAVATLRQGLPDFRRTLGDAIAELMTVEELDQTAALYRSPLGQRLLQRVYAMFKDGEVSDGESEAGFREFMASLSPDEIGVLAQFSRTSAGGKVSGIGPRLRSVSAEWTTRTLAPLRTSLRAQYLRRSAEFLANEGKTR
ncbi:MAG: DUF2059 domain-containing protein [Pseudomonadota bacterium]